MWWALTVAIRASAVDPLGAIEAHQQALFEQVAPSVVFVSGPKGFGSGLVVDADGLVLTNRHVVGDGRQLEVVLLDGTRRSAEVVERAADEIDLALLRIDAQGLPVPTLQPISELRVGSWVAAVGHGRGGAWTFNVGMVSNIYPEGVERPIFQTQIPLNPGNSGGPVIDRTGGVVGIVTAGFVDSQAINFAIPIDTAFRALEGMPDTCPCLLIDAPAGVPVYVDGRMVGKGPRVVWTPPAGTHEVSAVVGGVLVKQTVRYPAERRVDVRPTD